VSFKIIIITSVTRPCFTTQHQTFKTKTMTDYYDLVLRPTTVSDHITGLFSRSAPAKHYSVNFIALCGISNSICNPTCRKAGQTVRTSHVENQKNYFSERCVPNLWEPWSAE